jgi:hypothetical protein
LAIFATGIASGLLVVTNFLELSEVPLVVGFAGAAAFGGDLTGAAFAAAGGFGAFFGGAIAATFFAGTAFAGVFAEADFTTGLATTFFAGADFTGALAGADFVLATGLAEALLDAPAAPRAAGFARAGAFAACALLPAFCLLVAIPQPIL